jgi:hypothetical protein
VTQAAVLPQQTLKQTSCAARHNWDIQTFEDITEVLGSMNQRRQLLSPAAEISIFPKEKRIEKQNTKIHLQGGLHNLNESDSALLCDRYYHLAIHAQTHYFEPI